MKNESAASAIPEYTDFRVGSMKLSDLFASDVTLLIPEYQRPYVWNQKNIEELLNDWRDHFFTDNQYNESAVAYYMGAVMIHKDGEILKIIDGQQRLTTLLIMDYVWNAQNSVLSKGKFNFTYTSKHSVNGIRKNQQYLGNISEVDVKKSFLEIMEKLVFSVVITISEDKAFVFFDSQNNRGVPLSEVDFFKSYHLRVLNGHEGYLERFARKFDQINVRRKILHGLEYANNLNGFFKYQLWRIRFWSKNILEKDDRNLFLDTFQKNTVSFGEGIHKVRLYPSMNNQQGTSLIYDDRLNCSLETAEKQDFQNSLNIPFTINQPIQKGIGFFLYTEKYTALFDHLFREKNVMVITKLTDLVYSVYNEYFISLYHSCVIMYYDKFGEEKIDAFVKWLEHFMGAFRMNRYSVVEQSPIVLLRDYGNVLMEIRNAFLPEEVTLFLNEKTREDHYKNFKYRIDAENNYTAIQSENGKDLSNTRQGYYQKIKSFYQSNGSEKDYELSKKHEWIYGSINQKN